MTLQQKKGITSSKYLKEYLKNINPHLFVSFGVKVVLNMNLKRHLA
jgi:hypothetical protein